MHKHTLRDLYGGKFVHTYDTLTGHLTRIQHTLEGTYGGKVHAYKHTLQDIYGGKFVQVKDRAYTHTCTHIHTYTYTLYRTSTVANSYN